MTSRTPSTASMVPQAPNMASRTPTAGTNMSSATAVSRAANASSSSPETIEYTVRTTKNSNKKFSIMKFNGPRADCLKSGPVYMQRENNYKNFKIAHDVDMYPTSGAGSEFGRQQKMEARCKKYGMATKRYNPYEQPWLMRVGEGKNAKRYKATKEGGITENADYFVLTQCPDGAFETCSIDDWYTANPVINYRYLNSEEAEEEFSRRDKNLNLRSIMLKKRLKGEDALDEEEMAELQGRNVNKTKKKRSGLKLTNMDDWDDSDDSEEDSDAETEERRRKKAKQAPKKKHNRGGQKTNSGDEALEESDDHDEGAEVDYMSSSDSEDDLMFQQDKQRDKDTYEEKGVADEKGLLTLINSDSEDEEEEERKEEQPDEEKETEKKDKMKKSQKDGNNSDSDFSSSSDSDSDIDESNVHSALLLQAKRTDKSPEKADKKKLHPPSSSPVSQSIASSNDLGCNNAERSPTSSPVSKKPCRDAPTPLPSSGPTHGITDDEVRRYLLRKPMTAKDLLYKFTSKKLNQSKEEITRSVTQCLKRISFQLQTQHINGKLHFFIKK